MHLFGRKENLFISPVPVKMKVTYNENTGAECNICYRNRDFFIENFCDCTGYVCQCAFWQSEAVGLLMYVLFVAMYK